ncbi:MAG: tryptophan-rich sensory protein [Hyphomicrobiaceae bacterium]|nr:tryptophan-rich sensory protein [Hyphomicrobiaceae bacterium]
MQNWTSLIPFFAAVIAIAVSGAVFMPGPWYKALDKPSWTPPDWLFGPAWTLLYIAIAVAGWLVWREDGFRLPLFIWAANLVFNGAWSWLMFGRHRIGLALVDAILMLVTIVAFIAVAWPVSETAALLFIPYLAWVLFATALNWSIFARNRGAAQYGAG